MTTKKEGIIIISLLITLVCLPQASIGLYLPSLPHMIQEFHAQASDLQLTISIYMIGYSCSMLICGTLSDRWGRKPVIIGGLIIYVIATVICLSSSSITIIILGRFLQALGGCCGTVVARVIAKDIFPEKIQVTVLTYLSTAIALTPAIAPILGGWLESQFGWRMAFWTLLVFASLILVMVLCILPETNKTLKQDAFQLKVLCGQYKRLLSHRHFIGYSLAISLAWCAYYSFIQTSSFVFQQIYHVSPIQYGWIYATIIIGYLLGTVVTRKGSKKIPLEKLILILSSFALAFAILLAIVSLIESDSYWLVVIPIGFMMIGIGGIFPACQAAVMKPFNEIAGTASGLFFFIQMISGALCGLILGQVKLTTPAPMISAILLSCVILFLSYYFIMFRKQSVKALN
ncbi:multidrug effflux MFS transporter [Thermoactinomyces sp. DSM 45892]|uniref:multidrug effflux MFS transporter n=1 Tax=Thermoactinomyces sp. DSM 45892 TaxID=1882753 RepID=UPI0008966B1C|nr:multidrug effflux MFS transporter [Thermoactinomyces sp. DSM 45892]SDZ34903.1 MFS transporter, DHA1 family, bicyclomycin/chloramphenicol resistance protein [Thermoactinomyces sp. DSM 45892]